MPYRRFPKTDAARQVALKALVNQAAHDGFGHEAVSPKVLMEAQRLATLFEQAHFEYRQAVGKNLARIRKIQQNATRARMYVSHFIQVLNLCVIRGEIPRTMKSLYGLPEDRDAVPDLASEERLLHWGEKIINGEQQRTRTGGMPIYNPPIAKVKVYFENFKNDVDDLKMMDMNVERYKTQLEKMQVACDTLLQDAWNEIEAHFADIQDVAERLDACRKYGVIYYYRRHEPRPDNMASPATED